MKIRLDIHIPKNKKFDVVGIGMNAIDHLIVVPQYPIQNTKGRLSHYELQGGGQIGTGLTALSRLGAKVKYLGKLGEDWQGEIALKMMKNMNIDTEDAIIEKSVPNQFAFVIVNKRSGERTVLAHRHKNLSLNLDDFSKKAVTSGKILFLDGSGSSCTLQCAKWAKEEGIPIVIDIERLKDKIPEILYLSDFIITSENFALEQYPNKSRKDFLIKLKETYNPYFCGVTLGEKGALGYFKGKFIEIPVYPVKVIDTTGAGDVYHAAFIMGILKGWDLEYIMKFSAGAAALKCRFLGGRKGVPTIKEVFDFIRIQPFS